MSDEEQARSPNAKAQQLLRPQSIYHNHLGQTSLDGFVFRRGALASHNVNTVSLMMFQVQVRALTIVILHPVGTTSASLQISLDH